MITTTNIYDREDWFHATATAKGVQYGAWSTSRQGAFNEVLLELANAGHIKW